MNRTELALVVALLAAPALSRAEDPPAPPPTPPPAPAPVQAPEGATLTFAGLDLKISGVLFTLWRYQLAYADGNDTNGANNFDLTRAYINVEPHVSKNVWLRITPDVFRDGSGNLALRLKYAYVQFNEVLPGVAIKAGVQHTAYIDFEDSIWKYRVLGPAGYETLTGMPSSDLGIGALGNHAGGLLAWQVVLSNGEGYTKPENPDFHHTRYKDLAVRATVAPLAGSDNKMLKGLKLTAFAQHGITQDPDGPVSPLQRTRVLGLASYESELLTVAAGGGATRDDPEEGGILRGQLITAFGFVNLPLELRLLARIDRFDPDTNTEGDDTEGLGATTRVIAGVARTIVPGVQVVADYQALSYENEEGVNPGIPGSSFFVHLEARY